MKPDYDNSIPFDRNIDHLKDLNLDIAVNYIKAKILATGRIQRWHSRHIDHLRLILLNFINCHRIDPAMYIAYTRDKNWYSSSGLYSSIKMSHEATMKIIGVLWGDLGYVEGTVGYFDSKAGVGRLSRMRATPKFIDLLSSHKIDGSKIRRNDNEEIIILKDTEKKQIKYDDNRHTKRMRKNLEFINSNIAGSFIGLWLPDENLDELDARMREKTYVTHDEFREVIDYSKIKLRRVFNNGKFDQGGRYQPLLPKDLL